MGLIPIAALIVIGVLFRHDLGRKSLLVYFGLWTAGMIVAVLLSLPPGYFLALQCGLAISMLIQLGINPRI